VGAPLRPGHKLKLLPNGNVFDELTQAIRQAKQSVNIEMSIWSHGRASTSVVSALRERRKRVACCVLLDAEGIEHPSHSSRRKLASGSRSATS